MEEASIGVLRVRGVVAIEIGGGVGALLTAADRLGWPVAAGAFAEKDEEARRVYAKS